jgi:DNA recombination protein RmuC
VIDSKVSLAAYEQYVTSEDENDRTQKLKEHLSSVKNHIKGLSEKNYQDIYELQSLDFVMLFMPIEPAYLLAIHTDAELWSYAYEKRVLLISPTNLIAALKLVANLWRQENQNKNAMEIANQGGALYDKFVAFAEDLEELGRKLDSTKKSYDESINKLKSGKGNLIRRAENIRILGAKTKKIMPPGLNDEGMDE